MSGRGHGRGSGGRGRGGGRGSFKKRYNKNNKPRNEGERQKKLSDYSYYLGSSKQASDFEITTSFVINHIKKTYENGIDIANALKNLQEPNTNMWKPELEVSLIVGDQPAAIQARADENRRFEMEYKQEYSNYTDRLSKYKSNMIKAYALLWERCARGMKDKIESREDFDEIEDKPIALLKAIRQHALNYQEYRYVMSIVSDALKNLVHTKQKDDESLQDYAKRFKTATEIPESHLGGPIMIPSVVGQIPNFQDMNEAQKVRATETVSEQLLAFLFIEQADHTKYGSLVTN